MVARILIWRPKGEHQATNPCSICGFEVAGINSIQDIPPLCNSCTKALDESAEEADIEARGDDWETEALRDDPDFHF
jgi:hypothetical protein